MWISLRNAKDVGREMMSGNRGGRAIWSLDPPPLGESKCMEIHRKSLHSDCQHEVRQCGGNRAGMNEGRKEGRGEREMK